LDLRKDILGLYGKVVANMDAIHLEKLDKNSKLDYNGLIKLLVRSYTDIEHKDFKQLKENYSHVYNLYNKLPIGFVKGNVKLKDEITKFHKLIKLLDVTNKLYELDNQNQKRELNNALRYILDNYIRLLDQAPEAQKLLDYVKMKYDKFQDNLRLATISSPEMSEFEKEIDETEHKLARSKKLLSEASQVRSRVGEAEELKKEIKARIQQLTQKQLERNKERLNLKNQIQNEKSFLKDYSRQKSAFEEPQQFQLHNEAQIHKESLPKPKLMLEPPKAVSREPIKETEETRRFREKLLKRRNELEKPTQVKQGPNLVEHYVQEEREKIEELKGLLGKKRKTLQEKRELLLKKNKIKSRIKELKIITEKQELAKRYFSHRRTYSIKKDVDKIYQDGLNHLERRNYTNAIICFKKILSAKPDHINAMIKLEEAEDKKKNEKGFPLKDRLVELKMRKIKANIGNEKNDILMNEVNEVLKLDPQNKEAQELLRKIIIEG